MKSVPVSLQVPLLSNLTVIENIALVQEVHEKFDRKKSHANALRKLQKVHLQHLAQKHISKCTNFEVFAVSLIRASMMHYATIIIVTPMMQYFSNDPVGELIQLIDAMEVNVPVMILDLILHENDYKNKGIPCHTIA